MITFGTRFLRRRPLWLVLAALLGSLGLPPVALADVSNAEVSITAVPLRLPMVNGDREKFQAHHWISDTYDGGIRNLSARYLLDPATALTLEGHAFPGSNDYATDLALTRDQLGFVTLDFSEFRKYYEGTGGAHHRFTTLTAPETDRELALDLGKLGLTSGLTLEGWPELTVRYERDYKDGAKSRLTWTPVTEISETRSIGPSWQEVEETVDSVALQAAHELGGFTMRGEQRWEFVRSEFLREERSLSTNSTAAENKIRRQDQTPLADLMTTTLETERHFWEDKLFVGSVYRFAHMDNQEVESIIEFNAAGVETNFTNPKRQLGARADNDYDSHTWVGSTMAALWPWLSLGTKVKSEVIKRESFSTYPADTEVGTPDNLINRNDVSQNDLKAVRWGEGFTIRMTGIPRTALYTELELEQGRVLLREARESFDGPDTGDGVSASERFQRETVTNVRRGTWTLGGRTSPWTSVDWTAHVRRRVNDNDYDDQRESVASGTALSAFVDEQNVHTNELSTRLTWRPCRWARPSIRYQFRDDTYSTRFEAQDTVKTDTRSHIYTYDLMLQPLRQLSTTASFSRQDTYVATPAQLASSAKTPAFNADVNTWLLGAEYAPHPAVALTGSLHYATADNFNDFSATGLPLGAAFDQLDMTAGITWALGDRTSVGAEYAYYSYNPNENVEVGEYDAHVLWLEITQKF